MTAGPAGRRSVESAARAGLLGGGRDVGLALRARDLPLDDRHGQGRDLFDLGGPLVGGVPRRGALGSPSGRADARAAHAARLAGSTPSGLRWPAVAATVAAGRGLARGIG